ncbi:MAG: methylmalonyl Co-A mutase-associated GTPase MeaB [Myxococcales bacterium]|nr:methylmalonyl Co-A mutase-associated GTPase MeaB [Myxococcales bacterium]
MLAREREAVAEALNLADDHRPERRAEALALLDVLERETPFPGAERVGFTGAPGAGKSTLLDALLRVLRAEDRSVAIVAVDPSSRRSGGALLGDRFRMRSRGADPGVFIRSMAARDQLGGVADAARAGVTILSAVFDCVLVETVGVGQSESEVTGLVDTLVFVANPGSGDALQFMKAGVLELPDVFVVNKADVGGDARRTASELANSLQLGERDSDAWRAPVLLASARDGQGVEALARVLSEHRAHLLQSATLETRRAAGREAHVIEGLVRRYGSFGIERVGGVEAITARVREHASRSSFAWLDVLAREIEDALRKPA